MPRSMKRSTIAGYVVLADLAHVIEDARLVAELERTRRRLETRRTRTRVT